MTRPNPNCPDCHGIGEVEARDPPRIDCPTCVGSLRPRVLPEAIPAPKPLDYHERRKWQDAERAAGRVPECGRGVCDEPASPAYVNKGTPLLYCRTCAALINRYNPGLCSLETM